jgi:hypothetical protein
LVGAICKFVSEGRAIFDSQVFTKLKIARHDGVMRGHDLAGSGSSVRIFPIQLVERKAVDLASREAVPENFPLN